MNTEHHQKKSAKNWRAPFIVAELKVRNLSCAELSRMHGYKGNAIANALRTPWLRAEKIIADAIGLPPESIWPERYEDRKRKPKIG